MRARDVLWGVLPFVPFVGGLVLSTLRFRAHDPLGGLLLGEAGFVAMIALAVVLPEPKDRTGGVRPHPSNGLRLRRV